MNKTLENNTLSKRMEKIIMKILFHVSLILGFLFLTGFMSSPGFAQSDCPPGKHWDAHLVKCVPNQPACPPGMKWTKHHKKCVSVCPHGRKWDESRRECVSFCPTGMYWDERRNECFSPCEHGMHRDDRRECVPN